MSNIPVGKPDTHVTSPSHIEGVREGNQPGSYEKQPGHYPNGTSDAQRSTGISAKKRNPVAGKAPNLSPA